MTVRTWRVAVLLAAVVGSIIAWVVFVGLFMTVPR